MQETWVHSLGQEDPLEKGHSNLLQYFCLENSIQRGLMGYSPWGCKESDTTEQLTHPRHFYDQMDPETQALAVSPGQTEEKNASLDSQAECLLPHVTSFLKSVQRCPKCRGLGWRAIFSLGTQPVPSSLPICMLGSAQVCHWLYPGCKWFPNRTKQCLRRTSEKLSGAHVQMNAESSVLPASLLPWPRATPSWCFFLAQEAERNLKFPQGVEPQMQEEHFLHWCFKTISQSPNRQPHAITDQKAKSASLDCVCVCIKTQIIRFEGKSDSQQNSLRWRCGFWPRLGREEERLISDKSYLFNHQICGEKKKISLRQTQNVIYKDRIVFFKHK